MAGPGRDGHGSGGGYERSDMSLRVVGVFVAGLLAAVGVVLLLMGGAFQYFAARAARRDAAPVPVAAERPSRPEPRLEVHGARDLKAARAAEDAVLNSYGWVDRKGGTVRLPIDRAMDLLVERGLPSRDGPAGRP